MIIQNISSWEKQLNNLKLDSLTDYIVSYIMRLIIEEVRGKQNAE